MKQQDIKTLERLNGKCNCGTGTEAGGIHDLRCNIFKRTGIWYRIKFAIVQMWYEGF